MAGLQNAQPPYRLGLNRTLAATCRLNWIHAGAASTWVLVDYGLLLQGSLGEPLVMLVLMLLADGTRAAENRSKAAKENSGEAWLWEQYCLDYGHVKKTASRHLHITSTWRLMRGEIVRSTDSLRLLALWARLRRTDELFELV